jgi:hypothetical protein
MVRLTLPGLELLALCRLASEQKGFRVFPLAADLERTEVLEPRPVRRLRLRLSPDLELIQVFDGDLSFAQAVEKMVA